MNKARSFWAALFSQVGFFWLVLLVFMAVSVTESGDFFNRAIVHDVAGGILGYAVAGTFDLLSIVFLLARLNASRIADRRGEWLALLGVVVCAGVSAFANVATSVQSYTAAQFSNIPAWMQSVSPFLALVFPAMIIFTSLIADHVGDLNPQRADSIEKYRMKEQKKVDLLRVRLEIERDLAGVRREMAALRSKPSKKQGQALATLQAEQDAQIRELSAEIEHLKMLLPPAQGPDTDKLKSVAETDPEPVPPTVPDEKKQETKTVPQTATKTVPRHADTTALKAVRRAVKRDPEIKPVDLAKKAQISAGYASKLKTKVLAETLQVAATN